MPPRPRAHRWQGERFSCPRPRQLAGKTLRQPTRACCFLLGGTLVGLVAAVGSWWAVALTADLLDHSGAASGELAGRAPFPRQSAGGLPRHVPRDLGHRHLFGSAVRQGTHDAKPESSDLAAIAIFHTRVWRRADEDPLHDRVDRGPPRYRSSLSRLSTSLVELPGRDCALRSSAR